VSSGTSPSWRPRGDDVFAKARVGCEDAMVAVAVDPGRWVREKTEAAEHAPGTGLIAPEALARMRAEDRVEGLV
jgi:hypothetical protein